MCYKKYLEALKVGSEKAQIKKSKSAGPKINSG